MDEEKDLEKEQLERERLQQQSKDDFYDDSYDDDFYDDYDEEYDEDYDGPKLGEEQFDKTIEDKDYYKNRNEELEKDLKSAQEESERDTLTLDKDGNVMPREKDSSADSASDKPSDDNNKNDVSAPNQGDDSNSQANPEEKKEKEDATTEQNNDEKKEESGKESKDNENTGNSPDSNDNKKKNSKNDREVVAVNPDGSKVVKKNQSDRKKDQKNIKNVQRNLKNNKLDEKMAKAYGLAHPIEAAKKQIKAKIKQKALSVIAKFWPYILAGIGIFLLCLILFCLIGGVISYILGNEQTGVAGYYEAPCQEITVIGVQDENGNYSEGGTYSVEDYVAGVLASEVGNADNMEVYKAFAIAIRTYTFNRVNSSCSIENSTSYQTFSETDNEDLIRAANETKGIVLVDEAGSLMSTMYDSCYINSIDAISGDITINQKNQVIAGDWFETNKSKFIAGDLHIGHGQGMSQCGAYYLGDNGYTYDQILNYYYDEIVFKSTFMTTGIEGLEEYILDSTGTVILRNNSLENLFNSQYAGGFAALNQKIADNVNQAGYATRGGVVAAAVTLIGEVGNLGYRVPYYWGGGQGADGVDIGARNYWGTGSTGTQQCSTTNSNKIHYDTCGLDCGGFVRWALYNAGFKANTYGSDNFRTIGEPVPLKAGEAVVQAGDLLHSPGHIMLVVGVDFNTNEYIIAEAQGKNSGVLFSRRSFGSGGEGVKMDVFYNNEANKR